MKTRSWILAAVLLAGSAPAGAEPVLWLISRGGVVSLADWPASCTTYAGPGTLHLPDGRTVHLKLQAVVVCPEGKAEEPYVLADLDGDGLVDVRPLGYSPVVARTAPDSEE